jgi:hypothetical protein
MRKIVKIVLILLIFPVFSVGAADFKYQVESAIVATDTQIDQWYLDKINARKAWELAPTKKKIVVAVLDTGIDMNHPDIQQNIWVNMDELDGDKIDNDGNGYIDDVNGWNFLTSMPDPRPKFEGDYYTADAVKHGTFVAGIIAALKNSKYIDGVAPDVKIMPLLVLNNFGYGDSYPVAEAINYAVDNGADVINLSFGGVYHSQALKTAVLRAYDTGAVIVAAAGNGGDGGTDIGKTDVYPICYDKEVGKNMVLGVSAVDEKDVKAEFSNFGSSCVDISAPGINISSLSYQDDANADFKNYTISNWKGTSFATAIVSGAAALLKANHPDWPNVKIYNTLLAAAQNIDGLNAMYASKLGAGRLDIAKAAEVANKTDWNLIKIFVSTAMSGTIVGFDADGKKINSVEVFNDDVKGLNLDIADVNKDGDTEIIVGGVTGDLPWVRVIDLAGKLLASFLAYPENFTAGVNVAVGDIDKDGALEIVTAPSSKVAKPEIKIFDLQGTLKKSFVVGFKNMGLALGVGDTDADGKAEIVVGTGSGVSPEIKIFDNAGKLKRGFKVLSPTAKGGFSMRVRDVVNDSMAEILIGAGAGNEPQVQVFNGLGKRLVNFLAFDKKNRGGIQVDSADINGDGAKEILVIGSDKIKVFSASGAFKQEITLDKIITGKINYDFRCKN